MIISELIRDSRPQQLAIFKISSRSLGLSSRLSENIDIVPQKRIFYFQSNYYESVEVERLDRQEYNTV